MKIKISDIMKEVRVILDRNSASEKLVAVADIDTLTLNESIISKIEDAAKLCILEAPLYMIGFGKPYEDISVYWDKTRGIGSGHILLPDDYLRLVTFQMSDWSYPIVNLISEDSSLYSRQHSRFSGVRGCPQKPVGAYVNHPAGAAIEFFSCSAGEEVYVKKFRYVAVPKIEKDDCEDVIELPHKLKTAMLYCTAYLTAASIELNIAATLAETFKTYLK